MVRSRKGVSSSEKEIHLNAVHFEDYVDVLEVRVGKFLLEQGYQIPGYTQKSLSRFKSHIGGFDILRPRKGVDPARSIYGHMGWERRRDHPGTLEISTFGCDGTWKLKVFGRNNVEEMTRIAKSMAEIFGVDITVSLESEQPRVERFLADSDF